MCPAPPLVTTRVMGGVQTQILTHPLTPPLGVCSKCSEFHREFNYAFKTGKNFTLTPPPPRPQPPPKIWVLGLDPPPKKQKTRICVFEMISAVRGSL